MAQRDKLVVILTPVANKDHGDYRYRVRQPFRALAQVAPQFRVAVITNVLPNKEVLMLAADLLVIRMVADADLIGLAWERKQAGRPTILEIADDFLTIPKSNPAAHYYGRDETRAILFQLLAQCELVQVTTAALRRKYRRYHSRIEVFENQLEQLRPLRQKDSRLTIVWGGSDGHFEDMKAVAPSLCQWLERHPNVRLALKSAAKIHDLFDGVPEEQLVVEEPGSLEEYLDFLARFHIGIAPLEDNEYNRCRSDIKFLEYASAGVVGVCAEVEPYGRTVQGGTTGVLFGTPQELLQRLDACTSNPAWCQALVREARRYARRERLELKHASRRAEVFLELLGGGQQPASLVNLGRWPLEETSPGFFEEQRIPETTALLEGMGRKDPDGSLPYFAQAIEINPKYDRPFLCAGVALARWDPERALRYFRHSLALNPSAVYARLLIGDVLARAGRVADAAQMYAAAWRQCPAYVDPLVRLAQLCSEAGEEERAERHLKMAAEICPHHPLLETYASNVDE